MHMPETYVDTLCCHFIGWQPTLASIAEADGKCGRVGAAAAAATAATAAATTTAATPASHNQTCGKTGSWGGGT